MNGPVTGLNGSQGAYISKPANARSSPSSIISSFPNEGHPWSLALVCRISRNRTWTIFSPAWICCTARVWFPFHASKQTVARHPSTAILKSCVPFRAAFYIKLAWVLPKLEELTFMYFNAIVYCSNASNLCRDGLPSGPEKVGICSLVTSRAPSATIAWRRERCSWDACITSVSRFRSWSLAISHMKFSSKSYRSTKNPFHVEIVRRKGSWRAENPWVEAGDLLCALAELSELVDRDDRSRRRYSQNWYNDDNVAALPRTSLYGSCAPVSTRPVGWRERWGSYLQVPHPVLVFGRFLLDFVHFESFEGVGVSAITLLEG
jgi:hypothetical protein